MAIKVVLICCVAAFCFLQFIAAAPDATATTKTDTSKELDDALNLVKSSFDNVVKNIQGNEMLANLTQMIKNFGEEVSDKGKQLVSKIQNQAAGGAA